MPNLQHFLTDEAGQDLIEYALIAWLLALGAVASFQSLSSSITSFLINVSISLTAAI